MSVALLIIGGAICALNFYLSFLRVPLLRCIGHSGETKFVSGFPLIGSVLVTLALAIGLDSTVAQIVACFVIAIDTGGPHWFMASLASQAWKRRGRSSA